MNKSIKKLESGDFEVINDTVTTPKLKREICIAQKLQEQGLNSCEIKDIAMNYHYLEEDNDICVCEFIDGSKLVIDNGEVVAIEVRF